MEVAYEGAGLNETVFSGRGAISLSWLSIVSISRLSCKLVKAALVGAAIELKPEMGPSNVCSERPRQQPPPQHKDWIFCVPPVPTLSKTRRISSVLWEIKTVEARRGRLSDLSLYSTPS